MFGFLPCILSSKLPRKGLLVLALLSPVYLNIVIHLFNQFLPLSVNIMLSSRVHRKDNNLWQGLLQL